MPYNPQIAAAKEMAASKPFSSWVFNAKKNYWVAPLPFPTDGRFYLWDEDNFAWEYIEIEAFK